MKAYEELERRFARLAKLDDIAGVLRWDAAVKMPPGGAEARSEQMATVKVISHQMLTDPEIGELIERADSAELDDWQTANLREMRRRYVHATAVPDTLVDSFSRMTSRCEMVWRAARPEDDFERLEPHLTEVVAAVREIAHAKAEALGCSPYDALLDEYDPGTRTVTIDEVFGELADFLPEFIDAVLDRQAQQPEPVEPEGPFPVDVQRNLAHRLMERVGFEFDHGRLDTSAHPFCGGVPEDVRLTTNFDEDDFGRSLMAVLHETGHALYNRGLPERWRYQPVGAARGMSVHESQSLLVEMQVCRSRDFLEFAAPLIRQAFDREGPAWSADNLFRRVTRVERSLIRVDADEVTYPAHVILRYRLERDLIAGDLEVADLPEAWRAGMQELIGIAPEDDRDGCMQDIHWMDGAFGYFPTYTLGAIIAAQLYTAAGEQNPDLVEGVRRGDFEPLLSWLRTNVHQKGSRRTTPQLVAEAAGHPLDVDVYKAHLEQRYLGG